MWGAALRALQHGRRLQVGEVGYPTTRRRELALSTSATHACSFRNRSWCGTPNQECRPRHPVGAISEGRAASGYTVSTLPRTMGLLLVRVQSRGTNGPASKRWH